MRTFYSFCMLLSMPLAGGLREAPAGSHRAATLTPKHAAAASGRRAAAHVDAGGIGTDHAIAFVQNHNTPTTVTSESFFQRLQDSMVEFVLGLVLIVFSIPVLWFNESRNARMEGLIGWAEYQCRPVEGKSAETENRNWLVHLEGEQMRSAARTGDPQFDVAFERDCVRLRSSVEVFQVIEHQKKEEREKLGGGKETITTYTYTKEWSSSWHDSSSYQDKANQNVKPDGLELGARTTDCSRVEYGEAFMLTTELVAQCTRFAPAAPRLGNHVEFQRAGCSFAKDSDGYFYYRRNGAKDQKAPMIGDARVHFEYVPDGQATVMALQVDSEGSDRDSFLPYRLVSRGWCGITEDQEKRELRRMAEKSNEDLAAEAECGTGCLWYLCCACNVVTMCFASLLTPEIYHLFPGRLDVQACFRDIRARTRLMVWALRAVGWLMMFIGLYLLFSPILTFIKLIPFLGPILSSLGGWLIWFLCLVVTLAVATIVVCLAYSFYHPITAILYAVLAAAIVVVPLVLVKAL
mmetsp:Transcript_71754/g.198062  ORF Transcript_71754/g.198062 Transcript_71754/m.198062 type:complete len:520 (+) Transcript_71754:94-1653(+)